MTSSAKFDVAGVEFEVEVSSETSYGYDLTKGIEYEFKDESFVPYGSIGTYTRLEAWNVYHGDLYFYGEGDRWYRVTGTTIEVPIEPTIFGGVDPLQGGHIEAKQGIDLGEVRFNCVWDVGKKASILVAHHTVEALNACTVPDGWDDTIPAIEALDKLIEEHELDPDLIAEVREIQRADTDALQAALEHRAGQLMTARG